MRSGIYLLVLCSLLCAALASAQEPHNSLSPPESRDSALSKTEERGLFKTLADRFYLETTESLVTLSEKLDSLFPNPDNLTFDYHRTRIQAQAGLQVDSRGEILALQRFSGRVVLPRLEKRLSLYFSGSGQDLNQAEEGSSTANLFFLPNVEDTHFRFGFNTELRFVFTESKFYLVQNQLGVRLLPSWDPYEVLSGKLRIPFGNFLFLPGEFLFWRQSTGFGQTTQYDLDYALSPNSILRLHQEGTLAQESNGYEHRHSLAFLHQLTETRGYVFALEASGETSPTRRFTRYLAGFTWKELVYEDWLFVETGTNVTFRYDESFEPIPAIFFSLIADFNGTRTSRQPTLPREGAEISTP